MKKIILAVILLAAAGGAVYYYFQTKKPVTTSVSSYQKAILGEWKIDSITSKDSNSIGLLLLSLDSNLTKYTFRFTAEGDITQLLNDSITPQKGKYEWKDSTRLVIIEGDSLTDQEVMQVLTFTPEQLSLMSADSAVVHFKKKK